MELSRDRFVDHFYIPLWVQCLRGWSTRKKEAPVHVGRCLHEWIRTSAGTVSVDVLRFAEIVRPLIEETHRKTPKGEWPDAKAFIRALYDVLDKAGVEVGINAPRAAH